MIDHPGVTVGDFEGSKKFYAAALAPLGYELLLESHESVAGFGEQGHPDFWIAQGEANTPRIHVRLVIANFALFCWAIIYLLPLLLAVSLGVCVPDSRRVCLYRSSTY
jgi:hypothetical protein